jgi:hypothetical protein
MARVTLNFDFVVIVSGHPGRFPSTGIDLDQRRCRRNVRVPIVPKRRARVNEFAQGEVAPRYSVTRADPTAAEMLLRGRVVRYATRPFD